MRTWLPLLCVLACTPETPPEPAAPSTKPLVESTAAWSRDPSPAHLEQVSQLAKTLSAHPIGDPDVDTALASALTQVLLRPDLALPRLEPHANTLTGPSLDLWLDTLLRIGDLPRFTTEVQRAHGLRLDPTLPALKAASSQAAHHQSLHWRDAARAHNAADLANQHVRLQRKPVDLPVHDLTSLASALPRLHPGAHVSMVWVRSTNMDDPDPNVMLGAIPAKLGRRRVVSYAADNKEIEAATQALLTASPPRTVGVVAIAQVDRQPATVLCAEGRLEGSTWWMMSACGGVAEAAWVKASVRLSDLEKGGLSAKEAELQAQAYYRDQLGPTP
ncbi:MAG: hypothetical protein AB8H79_04375 [Myxococcota bacterium]